MTAATANPAPTPELIVHAARALAGICDGAKLLDGMGYSGVDTRLMKSLAAQERHSPRQLRLMWHILRKYNKQLAGHFGINFSDMVPPPLPLRNESGQFTAKRLRLIWVDTPYGRRIALVFGYDPKLVDVARQLEKRWFDKERKCWLIPDDVDVLDNALALFEAVEPPLEIEIDPELRRVTDEVRNARRSSYVASRAADSSLEVPTKLPLLPFQKAGVEFIKAHGGRALVGDEMGTGKSAQAIGYLLLEPEKTLPALVICPATLRINWVREVAKFSDLKCLIVSAESSAKQLRKMGLNVADRPQPGYDVTILNYDLVKVDKATKTPRINGLPLEAWTGFKTLIMDEAHYLKESKAQRTQAALALSQKVRNVILLTGTPLMNRPKEIWTLAKAVDAAVFPSFFKYAMEFCGARKDRFGWDFSGATNIDKLARVLRERIMIRREKSQVMSELPEKRRVTIPLALNGHLKEYNEAAKPVIEALAAMKAEREVWKTRMAALSADDRRKYLAAHAEEASRHAKLTGLVIAEITKLRQLAALAKMDAVEDFLLDTKEQVGKVLVFGHHHEVIDTMVERLAKAGIRTIKVDGREDVKKRQEALDKFQEGDAEVAVLGITAAGVGLTLTASSNVVFAELPWRPGDIEQAEARAHRYGQKNAVTSWFLVSMGTVEESIARVIDTKREVVNAVVGESDRTIEEEGILDAVLDDLVGNPK